MMVHFIHLSSEDLTMRIGEARKRLMVNMKGVLILRVCVTNHFGVRLKMNDSFPSRNAGFSTHHCLLSMRDGMMRGALADVKKFKYIAHMSKHACDIIPVHLLLLQYEVRP